MAENVYVLNTGVDIPDDFTATPTGSFNVKTSDKTENSLILLAINFVT